MRLTAYKKAMDKCIELPETIQVAGVNDLIYPRARAIKDSTTIARADENLLDSELLELLQYIEKQKKQKAPSQ